MHPLVIKRIDAFTTKPFCGNPAGVITEADGIKIETMQEIASGMKMNLIEIAFVTLPESEDALFRIRYFTPCEELGMSGHVTIATCLAMIEDGRIPLNDGLTKINLETKIGNIPIEIYFHRERLQKERGNDDENGTVITLEGDGSGILKRIMMQQPVQSFRPSEIPVEGIAEVLGIDKKEITETGLPVAIATIDIDWLIIPIKHKETILNMKPDLIKLGMLNRRFGIKTNHIFTLETFNPDCITYSRHFGPAVGLWEDPASAMPSAGLGTYLLNYGVTSSGSMIMEQGKEIDSLARIFLEVDRTESEITSVRVGGLAVTSIIRKIDVESGEILAVE